MPKLPKLIYVCYCQDPAAHADETFLGSGAIGAKAPQCIKEVLGECWSQVVLPTRAWCGSLGSSSRGRVCRKDAGALPAHPESNDIHPFHGLSELCMLPEWHSCPRRAPGPTCWHSGVSRRVCLRDQEHRQCSPPSFLLQGMIREETRRDSKSIPDFQPGVTGRI